jgi:hypothetical protein
MELNGPSRCNRSPISLVLLGGYHKYTISGIQVTAGLALVKHNFCFCCPSEEELVGLSIWGIFLVQRSSGGLEKDVDCWSGGCQALHGWYVISLTIPSLTSNFVQTVSVQKKGRRREPIVNPLSGQFSRARVACAASAVLTLGPDPILQCPN